MYDINIILTSALIITISPSSVNKITIHICAAVKLKCLTWFL